MKLHKNTKRIISLIAAFAAAFCLVGCSSVPSKIEIAYLETTEAPETTEVPTKETETTVETTEETTEEPTTARKDFTVTLILPDDTETTLNSGDYYDKTGEPDMSALWNYARELAPVWTGDILDIAPFRSTYCGGNMLYGGTMDSGALYEVLYDSIFNGGDTKVYAPYTPGWISYCDGQGTYIEISIMYQHMFFIENGKVLVHTNVRTGTVWFDWCTPVGDFEVQWMKHDIPVYNTNTTPDYANLFCNFWLNLTDDGIGIHDAEWLGRDQELFGGEYYRYEGSHGCINTPYPEMAIIYEHAYEGLPVHIFPGPEDTYEYYWDYM